MAIVNMFDTGAREYDTPCACDRCKRPMWVSDRVREWTGLLVCPSCDDPVPYQIATTPVINPFELWVEDPRPLPDLENKDLPEFNVRDYK